MNWANLITFLRLILLPIILVLLLNNTPLSSFISLLLFLLIILSDLLDGYVARRQHVISKFGSFLDPISDKLIVYALLLLFSVKDNWLLIILGLFLFRDLVVTYFRFLAAKNDLEIKEYVHRKLNIFFQYALIGSLLFRDFCGYPAWAESFYAALAAILVILLSLIAAFFSIGSLTYYGTCLTKGIQVKVKLGRELPIQPMLILANPRSRGYRDLYRRRLLKRFARKRKAEIVYLDTDKKDLFQSVANKIKKFKSIIIAGGDGTFESALNSPLLARKRLGFFPLGAGNAFYSYFYRGKRFEYLRSRFQFSETDLDILELAWENGKRKTLFAGIGIDAEVLRLAKERTTQGFLDYLGGCCRGWMRGQGHYDLNIKLDGKEYSWKNCVNLNFAKVPFYGYNVRSFPGRITPSDGLVYGLANVNPHAAIWNKPARLWGLILANLGINRAPLLEFQAKMVEINSETPFSIQAGGEYIGYSSWLKVKVVRKQKVLVI